MKTKLSFAFLNYLRLLARLQLAKIRIIQSLQNKTLTTVGITGSAGKTSVMLAAQAAITPDFKVKTNYGGNSESGIPLNILGLAVTDFSSLDWLRIALLAPFKLLSNWQTYDVYLVEMGIDAQTEPKNMSYLLKILTPDIGVFLNVTPVHLLNFDSLENIAKEKALLPNAAHTAIINPEDKLVTQFVQNPNTIEIQRQKLNLKNYLLPPVYELSFGAAIAVGQVLGLKKERLLKNISKNFHLPPGRSTILSGVHQSTIIDSSYNSSPLATGELLEFLKTFKKPRVAVLGDMRELGKATPKSHRDLYQQALNCADTIISIGPETQKYFGSKAKKFLYWWQATDYLQKNLPSKATILVKGSQNTIFLEELIKFLLKDKTDEKLLCRQSPYWLSVKSRFRRQHQS